jgi:hypothetical protein
MGLRALAPSQKVKRTKSVQLIIFWWEIQLVLEWDLHSTTLAFARANFWTRPSVGRTEWEFRNHSSMKCEMAAYNTLSITTWRSTGSSFRLTLVKNTAWKVNNATMGKSTIKQSGRYKQWTTTKKSVQHSPWLNSKQTCTKIQLQTKFRMQPMLSTWSIEVISCSLRASCSVCQQLAPSKPLTAT